VTGPYAKLVDLADRELELVRERDYEGASRLQAARAKLVASLPEEPPPEALSLLEAAAQLQSQTQAALERDIAEASSELHAIRRGRHAVQAYTPAPAPGAGSRLLDFTG
jgi:hypothetical protein